MSSKRYCNHETDDVVPAKFRDLNQFESLPPTRRVQGPPLSPETKTRRGTPSLRGELLDDEDEEEEEDEEAEDVEEEVGPGGGRGCTG